MCVCLGYTFLRLIRNIHTQEVCEVCKESCFHWIKLIGLFSLVEGSREVRDMRRVHFNR